MWTAEMFGCTKRSNVLMDTRQYSPASPFVRMGDSELLRASDGSSIDRVDLGAPAERAFRNGCTF
jgi:hypothetical protein